MEGHRNCPPKQYCCKLALPEIDCNGLGTALLIARGDGCELGAPGLPDIVELVHRSSRQRVHNSLVKVEGAVFVLHEQFAGTMSGQLMESNLMDGIHANAQAKIDKLVRKHRPYLDLVRFYIPLFDELMIFFAQKCGRVACRLL